jgi:hypothetical protein
VIAAVTPESKGRVVIELEGDVEKMMANRDARAKRKDHDDDESAGAPAPQARP